MTNKFPKNVAVSVSLCSGLFLVIHLAWPNFSLDDGSLILIGIGFLPWLTLFVKKFKLPGGVEGETHQREQGSTEKPAPPVDEATHKGLTTSSLSPEEKKIMATLWRYQKQHFGDDKSKRWTFVVSPTAPLYSKYLKGTSELFEKGLISFAPDHHIMLTNEGIQFMEHNIEVQNNAAIYSF